MPDRSPDHRRERGGGFAVSKDISQPDTLPRIDSTKPHNIDHLGDFTLTRRTLLITLYALPVGLVSAGVAWCLLRLIGLITNLVFYGRIDSALVSPADTPYSHLIFLLVPLAGGLLIGLMARFGSEKIRGHGIPEALESILTSESKIQPRIALLKPVASAISIGTGGPFGAEGPIIMTGGAFGSIWSQLLHLTADERKILLVSGAAAGMSATFNAPLASVLLAVELLLFEWRPRSFVPVSAAVAVATIARQAAVGGGPIFPVPDVALHLNAGVYALCAVAGALAGVLALIATKLVYLSEDFFGRLKVHWMWWPAIGGLVVGVGGLFVPEALGVGYDVIGAQLDGSIAINLVIGILIVKTLIWSFSLGSGTSGGVLAPMLMIGGALGSLEALVFPEVAPGFWALVGIAGVLGGLMRSPLTGVVFAVELTHRYETLFALLICATTAYLISALILKRSVLTEKLARRGVHLTREYSVDPLESLYVSDVMGFELPPPGAELTAGEFLFADDTLRVAANAMAKLERIELPVVSRSEPGCAVGVIHLQQVLVGRRRDLHEETFSERQLSPLSLLGFSGARS